MNDLQNLELKTKKVNNETLASTRRMLALVHESQDAGAKTLEMLHAQGEQLNNAEQGLDSVQMSLLESNKHLEKMELVEKCWCCAFCQKNSKRTNDQQDKVPLSSKPAISTDQNVDLNEHKPDSNSTKSISVVHLNNSDRARNGNDDVDSNLEEVDAHVKSLKSKALDLGQVVHSHNTQLNRMNNKAEADNNKLVEVSGKASNLLKSTSSAFLSGRCCRYIARMFTFSKNI